MEPTAACSAADICCCAQVFDEFLTQLGEDVASYVRTVCHTIVLTVPKAIIHCQACTLLCCRLLMHCLLEL